MLDGIAMAICRPPRAKYCQQDLGPPRVRYKGVEYKRKDFTVRSRGLAVKGSVWELISPQLGDPESCILYLHPNSGSRADIVKTRIMSIAASAKCTICGFDFAGCGNSEGDHVTLGVREKEDVCAVMSYLLDRGYKRFVLWGRSMGAASAAMFFGSYKELLRGRVVAMILDSPFTSIQGLASEYTSSTKVPVPQLLLSPALHVLRQHVMSAHQFDIYHISPVAAAARINVPTVVLSGSEDRIVPPALSEAMYNALNGPKLRIFFNGGHNSHRPTPVFDAIRVALTGALRGLSSREFLLMAADVVKTCRSTETPQDNRKAMNTTTDSKDGSAAFKSSHESQVAKRTAVKLEESISAMLEEKSIDALSETDIKLAVEQTTATWAELPKATESSLRKNADIQSSSSTSQEVATSDGGRKSIRRVETSLQRSKHSVPQADISTQLDVEDGNNPDGGMVSGYSWSHSVGHFLWGSEQQASPPPQGSFGCLKRRLAPDICPPEASAWEELLVAQCTNEVFGATVDQLVEIVAALEDSVIETQWKRKDLESDDEKLLMSMIAAEVTAANGLVSVQGCETMHWGHLMMLSMDELKEIAGEKPSETATTSLLPDESHDHNGNTESAGVCNGHTDDSKKPSAY